MSAANSNPGDRELEALRRAQRAHEPSMEEILASIRGIIAEEREPAKPQPAKPATERLGAPVSGPQIVYSKDGAPPEPGLAPSTGSQLAEPPAPKVVWRQPDVSSTPRQAASPSQEEEPLLSPDAGVAVAASFESLSGAMAARSAEIADEMAREMLRPMLKTWLDENLPVLVERLVRAEIERIARPPR